MLQQPSAMAGAPVSSAGLSEEDTCRACLRTLADTLKDIWAEEDEPLTELDLQEMKAGEEGWGDEFRTKLAKRQWEELEDEARERESRNRLKQPDGRENTKACE